MSKKGPGITRSAGQLVKVAGIGAIVGGGYSGSTKELDDVVQKAAEVLRKEFKMPVQIRFNSDRNSGGAWLKDDVEGFWAYGRIGIIAGLYPKRPKGMATDEWIKMPFSEVRALPKELVIETNVKAGSLKNPAMANQGSADSRYNITEHKSVGAAIAWLRRHADIKSLGTPEAEEYVKAARPLRGKREVEPRTVVSLQSVEESRSARSRESDERQEHSLIVDPDDQRVEQWMRELGRMDVRGIDTPKRRSGGRRKTSRRSKDTLTKLGGVRR